MNKNTVPRSQYNKLAGLVEIYITLDAEKASTVLSVLLDDYFSIDPESENFAARLEYGYNQARQLATIVLDYISKIKKNIEETELNPIPEA